MNKCSIEGCEKPAKTRGWCAMHYMRVWSTGSTELAVRPVRACAVEGCLRPWKAGQFCALHYARWKRLGEPGPVDRLTLMRGQECSVAGCDAPVYAKTWCSDHYENNRLRGDPLVVGPGRSARKGYRKWAGVVCFVEGCDRPARTRGLCTMHYDRHVRLGDVGPAERKQAESGAGHVNHNGYREFSINGRHVLEHQIVMSRILGRELLPGENVHHINGQRADNRPENLELWVKSQPPGQRARDLVAWAKEIIDRYESVVVAEQERLDL